MGKFKKYHTAEAFEEAIITLEERVEVLQKAIEDQNEMIKKLVQASVSDVDEFYGS